MKVYGLWWGGASYAHPQREDSEEFPSIAAAEREMDRRFYDSYFPCVYDAVGPGNTDRGHMDLYAVDPSEHGDAEPIMRLVVGPRDGISREVF